MNLMKHSTEKGIIPMFFSEEKPSKDSNIIYNIGIEEELANQAPDMLFLF